MTVALGPGSTFAGYRVESLIDRGGMGVVYKATDLSLGRPVALKLIARELRWSPRDDGDPRLPVAGADPRRGAGRPERLLCAGLHPQVITPPARPLP